MIVFMYQNRQVHVTHARQEYQSRVHRQLSAHASTALFFCRIISDKTQLVQVCTEYLSDFNATSKKPMNLVLFSFALEHIVRICRVIKLPGGNALLVGLGGSGRQSLTRLAAFMEEYEVFQIEVSKQYGKTEWHEDLRKVIRMSGELNKQVVFLFSDTQIQSEGFVEDISNILNTYEVPNLLQPGDLAAVFENIRGRAKTAGMDGSRDALYSFFTQVRDSVGSVSTVGLLQNHKDIYKINGYLN